MSAATPEFTHPAPTNQFVAFALFAGQPPSVARIAEAVSAEFADVEQITVPAAPGDPEVPALVVNAQGIPVLVVPTPGPVPDDAATRSCHPVWWTDLTDAGRHDAHVVVTTLRAPEEPADHDRLIAEGLALAMISTLVLELPSAVGLYYGNASVTFPAAAYVQIVRDSLEAGHLPTDVWLSAWLMREEGAATINGCTVGLASFGHADLVVQDSTQEPSAVYGLLAGLGGQLIASGQFLEPESTIGPSEDEQYPVTTEGLPETGALLRIDF